MTEDPAAQGTPEAGVEVGSRVVIEELCAEPNNETILANRVKN